MNYQRVIPRDLFNEAKLLKGLGQMCLLIHDGQAPKGLSFDFDPEDPNEGFIVMQNQSTGNLFAVNLQFFANGELINIRGAYNSRRPYTLWASGPDDDDDEAEVFDNDGNFSHEFLQLIENIKAEKNDDDDI